MWSDLYKRDMIEAGSMVGHRHLRLIEGSPYLEALLKRGFWRRENRETTNPILEEAMMFTSMVGVEVLSDVGNTNKRVDALSLETSEGLAKGQLNITKVDQRLGEVDHWVEVLKELRWHYQQFLAVDEGRRSTVQQELGVLQMRCDRLVRTNRSFNQELQQYQNLVLLQTQTINTQNTYLQTMEEKVKWLEELVLPGRTLGNPILIEDDWEEDPRAEVDLRSPRPQVVMNLIEIED